MGPVFRLGFLYGDPVNERQVFVLHMSVYFFLRGLGPGGGGDEPVNIIQKKIAFSGPPRNGDI